MKLKKGTRNWGCVVKVSERERTRREKKRETERKKLADIQYRETERHLQSVKRIRKWQENRVRQRNLSCKHRERERGHTAAGQRKTFMCRGTT